MARKSGGGKLFSGVNQHFLREAAAIIYQNKRILWLVIGTCFSEAWVSFFGTLIAR
jgi:hypothetical protein